MVTVDKNTFENEVLTYKGTVIVEFWSQICEPCKELLPVIEKLDEKYGHRIKFCEIDTKKATRLAIKEKIIGLPAIAVYQNGEKIDEIIKEKATKENIEEMIKKYI